MQKCQKNQQAKKEQTEKCKELKENEQSLKKILRVHFNEKICQKQGQYQSLNNSQRSGKEKIEQLQSCRSSSIGDIFGKRVLSKNSDYYENQGHDRRDLRQENSQNCFHSGSSEYIIITRKDLLNAISKDCIKSINSLKTHSQKSFEDTKKKLIVKKEKEDGSRRFFYDFLKMYEGCGLIFAKQKIFSLFKEGKKGSFQETEKYLASMTEELLKKNKFNGQQIQKFRRKGQNTIAKQKTPLLDVQNQVKPEHKVQIKSKTQQCVSSKNQRKTETRQGTTHLQELKKLRALKKLKDQKYAEIKENQPRQQQSIAETNQKYQENQKNGTWHANVFSERARFRNQLRHIKNPSFKLQLQSINTQKTFKTVGPSYQGSMQKEKQKQKQKHANKINGLKQFQNALSSLQKERLKNNYFQLIVVSNQQRISYDNKTINLRESANSNANGNNNEFVKSYLSAYEKRSNRNTIMRTSLHKSKPRKPQPSLASIQSWVVSQRMNIKDKSSKQISVNKSITDNFLRNAEKKRFHTPKVTQKTVSYE